MQILQKKLQIWQKMVKKKVELHGVCFFQVREYTEDKSPQLELTTSFPDYF